MAQFRTTADIVDIVLRKGGELTDGTSQYEADVLEEINTVHQTIINGGNEFGVDMDEAWPWAKAPEPIVLELIPSVEDGSVSVTLGSEAGTFSSAPADSMEGRFLKTETLDDWFKIVQHTAGQTAFELDSNYTGDTNGAAIYRVVKLDYKLEAQKVIINSANNKLDFEETAASELTATLTNGAYTPAELATEIKTQLEVAGASIYTITYDSQLGKYTLASDLAGGGNTFKLLAQSGTNFAQSAYQTLGFDIEDQATAATQTSVYRRNGITRLYEPVTAYQMVSESGNIYSLPEVDFKKEFPFTQLRERTPSHYTTIKHTEDGSMTIRFNGYPADPIRVELDFIEVPIDLKDNEQSLPLLPRSYIQILINGGLFYLLTEKEDDKAQQYFQLAATKLKAMVKQSKRNQLRAGKFFGSVVARREQIDGFRGRRRWAPNSDLQR